MSRSKYHFRYCHFISVLELQGFNGVIMNSEIYTYAQKAKTKSLQSHVGTLYGTEPIGLRIAVYETRKYGGVRGALSSFMGRAVYSTSGSAFFLVVHLVYSSMVFPLRQTDILKCWCC